MSLSAQPDPLGHVEDLAAPSFDAIRLTFVALGHAASGVEAQCAHIEQTLQRLAQTLGPLTEGGSHLDAGSFGLMGLPLAGAMKAARGLIGEYVRQQTGQSLDQWLSLVVDAQGRFDGFLARLAQVLDLSARYAVPDVAVDRAQVLLDLALVHEVRWDAVAWKSILGGVGQLAHVVGTILQVDLRSVLPANPDAGGEGGTSLFGGALSRIKEAGTRAMDRTTDLREWVLRPLLDIRDRVHRLPAEVQQLSHDVALLEVLLELQAAGLRVQADLDPPEQARVVGRRIAAMVRLPELAAALGEARERAETARARGSRLRAALDSGQVDEAVFAVLDDEYRRAFDSAQADLADSAGQVAAWQRQGAEILAACEQWVAFELRVLAARTLAEQPTRPDPRESVLRREQQRLGEARGLLASLGAGTQG